MIIVRAMPSLSVIAMAGSALPPVTAQVTSALASGSKVPAAAREVLAEIKVAPQVDLERGFHRNPAQVEAQVHVDRDVLADGHRVRQPEALDDDLRAQPGQRLLAGQAVFRRIQPCGLRQPIELEDGDQRLDIAPARAEILLQGRDGLAQARRDEIPRSGMFRCEHVGPIGGLVLGGERSTNEYQRRSG
ncbi:MAG: hypothetical protein IPH48_13060 [bacterium]|nr:hypothetical protein [bacterium]